MTNYISQWMMEYGVDVRWKYAEMTGTLGLCWCRNGYCEIEINEKLKDRFTEIESQWHEFSHALAWLKEGERGHGETFKKYYHIKFSDLRGAIYRFVSSLIVDLT